MKYSPGDLQQRYNTFTERATAHCIFTTELVGGISADEAGIRAFVKHHLHLPEEQIEAAVRRIMTEEVGERDTTPETGELTEKLTYGVNVFRRSPAGPWIGDWMVKACIKAAASRLGLFASKRGSKGDIAEMGRVAAIGDSFLAPDRPEQIYLVDSAGKPIQTYYAEFKGRIQGPQGSASIVSHKECAPAGARAHFEFHWYNGKLSHDNIADIFAAAMNIGLGSAKAFERGKFSVELEIE